MIECYIVNFNPTILDELKAKIMGKLLNGIERRKDISKKANIPCK